MQTKLGILAAERSKREKVYRRDYPEKIAARRMLNDAVHNGELRRSVFCEECGLPKKTQGHHEDYSKSLEVDWLCDSCHKIERIKHKGKA